jgi:hypothetical protein
LEELWNVSLTTKRAKHHKFARLPRPVFQRTELSNLHIVQSSL